MSLYLPEAKLGKYSDPTAVSHKFVLKARQTGSLHRGHGWVFRAESHEVMLEWYEAIKRLTEITGSERNAFVQEHQRTASSTPNKAESVNSDNGFENDEADEVPYSGQASELGYFPYTEEESLEPPRRPSGGRFPSDIKIERGLVRRESTSDESSTSAVAAAAALPGASFIPDHDEARYTEPHLRHTDGRPRKHSYVVAPPVNLQRSTSPSSWSSEERVSMALSASVDTC